MQTLPPTFPSLLHQPAQGLNFLFARMRSLPCCFYTSLNSCTDQHVTLFSFKQWTGLLVMWKATLISHRGWWPRSRKHFLAAPDWMNATCGLSALGFQTGYKYFICICTYMSILLTRRAWLSGSLVLRSDIQHVSYCHNQSVLILMQTKYRNLEIPSKVQIIPNCWKCA